jgi:YfiH family protein
MQVLVPQWPVGEGIRAVCSTREGGVSAAPWHSLNLGDHVGDDPAAVAANRARYAQHLGVRPVFLRQVHGVDTLELDATTPDGVQADACHTQARGVACTIMVADCLPVLLADTRGARVAAAHAGWRGLLGQGGHGVLESAMQALDPAHTQAWLGPCIGPDAFEVGDEVRAAYAAHDAACVAFFRPGASTGKWLADLPGLARHRLQALGLATDRIHGNDGSTPWCTVTQPSRFFSHRRDRVSGRIAASIWLR